MATTIKDFIPYNSWKADNSFFAPRYMNLEPKELIDQSTGRRYLNESKSTVRFKCFLLTIGTPFVHGIISIRSIAQRTFKVISFYHFWKDVDPKVESFLLFFKRRVFSYNLSLRLRDLTKDVVQAATQSFTLIGLELSAIYGCINPYDGRKLYASLERFQYEGPVLAPCFQPKTTSHLFGGNIQEQNAF